MIWPSGVAIHYCAQLRCPYYISDIDSLELVEGRMMKIIQEHATHLNSKECKKPDCGLQACDTKQGLDGKLAG